eukprot:gene707-769_t
MDEVKQILSDPIVEQLLRNIAIGKKKWSELMADIAEMSSVTPVEEAGKTVLEAASKILRYETTTPMETSTIESSDIQRNLDFIRKSRAAAASSSSSSSSSSSASSSAAAGGAAPVGSREHKPFTRVVKLLFKKLCEEENLDLLMYLSELPFVHGVNLDHEPNHNETLDLNDLINYTNYVIEENNVIHFILLLKLVLTVLSSSNLLSSLTFSTTSISRQLSECVALSLTDMKKVSELTTKLESIQKFQCSPHPFPRCGSLNRCSRTEITGKVSSLISGFSLANYSHGIVYYEITLKLQSRLRDVRIGWAKRSININSHLSLGAGEDSWVVDLKSCRFLHNNGFVEFSAKLGSQSGGINDSDESFLGGLFDNDEESCEIADGIAQEQQVNAKMEDQTSDPNPFGYELLGHIDEVGRSIANGSILSCVLSLLDGSLLFYVDGKFWGQSPVPIDNDTVQNKDLVPCFSTGDNHGFDVNVGTVSKFQHLNDVAPDIIEKISSLSTRDASTLESEIVTAMRESTANDSCLQLGVKDTTLSVARCGWFVVSHLQFEAVKSYTMELCVWIDCDMMEVGECSLVSCGPSPDVALLNACGEDRSCRWSVDRTGAICFEVSGGEKVKTPPNAISFGQWYHLAVAYTYHRSSDRAAVQFFVNSSSVIQAEISSKGGGKLGKLLPRYISFGSESNDSNWQLKLADARIWSNARSSERIASFQGRGKIFGTEPDLLLYVPVEEGHGAVVHFISGGNSNRKVDVGVLNGGFCWSTVSEDHLNRITLRSILESESDALSDDEQDIKQNIGRIGESVAENSFKSLLQIALAVLEKFNKSAIKLRSCFVNDHVPTKIADFLLSSSLSDAVLSPSIPFFMVLNALFRQIISIFNSGSNQHVIFDLLVVMVRVLLKTLRINMELLHSQQDAWLPKNTEAFQKEKLDLLITLIYFVNGCRHVSEVHTQLLRNEAVELIGRELSFFLPSVDHRFKLFEVLLQSQYTNINDIKVPQLKRAVSNFKADTDFLFQEHIPRDPVRALLSMSNDSKDLLILILSRELSRMNTLQKLIPSYMSPQVSVAPMVAESMPYPGCFVKRGTDWCYGDEDGGSGSLGVVIDIADWKNAVNRGIIVAWKDNTECYRWGVEETVIVDGIPTVKRVYDLEYINTSQSNDVDHQIEEPFSKQNADSVAFPKRELLFSPLQVWTDLLGCQSGALSKRAILQYIKEVSSSEWQSDKKINKSMVNLLKELSTLQLCSLYQEFYCAFSSKSVYHASESLEKLLDNLDSNHVDSVTRVYRILDKVLAYIERCIPLHCPIQELLKLLLSIQLLLTSTSPTSSSTNCLVPKLEYSSDSFSVRPFVFNQKEFEWDWKMGQWFAKEIVGERVDSLSANEANCEKILSSVDIDERSLNSSIQVRKRSDCIDVIWSGHREWTTCLLDVTLPPNTGRYSWYLSFKAFSERKSHFMVGMCTKRFRVEEFLGQDRESFGLSQAFDFFHNGRKHRSSVEGAKYACGAILQILVDTDEPSIRFTIVHNNEVYSRTINGELSESMKGKHLVPAFSFFSPGDCVSIIRDPADISKIRRLIAARSDSSSTTVVKSVPSYAGSPGTVVMNYSLYFIRTMNKVLCTSRSITPDCDVLIGLFIHLMASLTFWAVPSFSFAEKLLESLSDLLFSLEKHINASGPTQDETVELADGQANRLKLISISNQISSVVVIFFGKLLHGLLRSDQCVPLNPILSGMVLRSNGQFSVQKKRILAFSNNKIFRNGLRNRAHIVESLVNSINQGDVHLDTFFSWINAFDHTHKHFKTIGGGGLDKAIKLAFVGMIYHGGLTATMLKVIDLIADYCKGKDVDEITQQIITLKPPSYFLVFWTAAASLRIWAKDCVGNGMSYESVSQTLTEKCGTLMSFESCCNERVFERFDNKLEMWLNSVQMDTRFVANMEKTCKEISLTVKVMVTENDHLHSVAAISKEVTRAGLKRCTALKHLHTFFDSLNGEWNSGLKCLLLNVIRRVFKGLSLNYFPTSVSDKVIMINKLRSSEEAWHYLQGLNGVSKHLVGEVQAAFNRVVTSLTTELSSNSERGSEYQLLLLDVLAVRVQEIDHELLARVNIFFTIQELLDEYIGAKATADIGLQIAITNEASEAGHKISSVDHGNLSHLELRKVKSGPATLSKAVFDIVFTLLKDIVEEMIAWRKSTLLSAFSVEANVRTNGSENSMIALEAMSLLLCVTRNKECCAILNKEKWLRLLLEMSIYGVGLGRARALLLLADLLPLAETVETIKINIAEIVGEQLSNIPVPSNCYETIVLALLYVIGDATLLGEKEATDQDYSPAIISEGVALMRRLLATPSWQPYVLCVIKQSLKNFHTVLLQKEWDSVIVRVVSACFFVMNGKVNSLYQGCPVLSKPLNNEEQKLGIVQSAVQSGQDQVDVIGFDLRSVLSSEELISGEGITCQSMRLDVQNLQSIDGVFVQSMSYPPELCKLSADLIVLLLNESQGDENNQFTAKFIGAVALKSMTTMLLDPLWDCELLLSSFSSVSDLFQFLKCIMMEGNKPCAFGSLNELSKYESLLASLLGFLRRSLSKNPHISDSTANVPKVSERSNDRKPVADASLREEGFHIVESNEDRSDLEDEEEDEERSEQSDHDERGLPKELVDSLASMGFPREVCMAALTTCGGDPEEALNYILTNSHALEDMVGNRSEQKPPGDRSRQSGVETGHAPQLYHYDGDARKLLALYSEPNVHSEILACVFPGTDISVLEESCINGATWYKLSYADFDDGHYSPSFEEELQDLYVWAPQCVDDVEVIKRGPYEGVGEVELADPPADCIAINKYYRIIGSRGATVRTDREISSKEVGVIKAGEVARASLETFNFDGTMRLQIDYPVKGWISKNLGLVELVEPDEALISAIHAAESGAEVIVPSIIESSVDRHFQDLVDLEDTMESLRGADSFSKEERFFGHLQGLSFVPYIAKTRLSSTSMPPKITAFQQSLGRSLADENAVKNFHTNKYDFCIWPIVRLYCRKLVLILLLRHVPILKNPKWVERSMFKALLELDPLDDVTCETLAESLVQLLRLTIFRGNPLSAYGVEVCARNALSRYTCQSDDIFIEEAMFEVLTSFSQASVPIIKSIMMKIEKKLVYYVTLNLSLACSTDFVDHSWSDTSYAEDLDEDLDRNPNVHFVLWIIAVLIKNGSVANALAVMESLLLALKFNSMSLKLFLFRGLANLLCFIRENVTSEEDINQLKGLLSSCPLKRYMKFVSRRLWHEMEDTPSYTRFLQSLLAFLSELRITSVRFGLLEDDSKVENVFSPFTSERKVLRFENKDSHVQFSQNRDVGGSWTVELWLRQSNLESEIYESDLEMDNELARKLDASSGISGDVEEKLLIQLLLQRAKKNRSRNAFGSKESSSLFSGSLGDTISTRPSVDAANATQNPASTDIGSESPLNPSAKKGRFLLPSVLFQSNKYFVKLRKGGRLFGLDNVDDPLQQTEPISEDAYCMSIGHQNSDAEKTFDCVVPSDEWVHLALVHDSVLNNISIYINGKLADSQLCAISLPMHTLGSPKKKRSFCGDLGELRVWSIARSEGEIRRDMEVDVRQHPFLYAHFSFQDSDKIIIDHVGNVGPSVTSGCKYVVAGKDTPLISVNSVNSAPSVNPFSLTQLNDRLMGTITIGGVGHKGALAQGLKEVVCLSYQVMNESNGDFVGILEWCDRSAKTIVSGKVTESGDVEFSCGGDVVVGPPERLKWLSNLKFTGSRNGSELQGQLELIVNVETLPPCPRGRIRVDSTRLSSTIQHNVINGFDHLAVWTDASDGQYVAVFEITPNVTDKVCMDSNDVNLDCLPFGIMNDQGSIWLEWLINSTGGNIGFGCCTHDALTHPDASVDANDGTWTYCTSGQASHGANLYLCEHADEGDIIALQINTTEGFVRFYKNNEVVVNFDSLRSDPNMQRDVIGSLQTQGIRPFVSLTCAGDSVSALPIRKGPIEILFPESDEQERGKFVCSLVDGLFGGYGLLGLRKNTEWWFGAWQSDQPDGLHVCLENIHAEDLVVLRGKRYQNGCLEAEIEVEDIDPEQLFVLVTAYDEFRAQRKGIAGSILADTNSPSQPVISSLPAEQSGNSLHVFVSGTGREPISFQVSAGTLLRGLAESYSVRTSVPVQSYRFQWNGNDLDIDQTIEQIGLTDQTVITAAVRTFQASFRSTDDIVEKFFPNSEAKYVVQVVYEPGATVRNGVEIESSASLFTLSYREVAEAFEFSFTSEGIKRYRIGDGWISDRLRGGTEARVVRILRERFDNENKFRVLREDGIKLRAGASLKSEEKGFIPFGTIVTIEERRVVSGEENGETSLTTRLRVVDPPEYVGWVSEKSHLLEVLNKADEGKAKSGDVAILHEINRRNKLRTLRKTKLALLESERKFTRCVSTKGEMNVSKETLFLWKKSKYAEGVRISPDGCTVSCTDSYNGRYMVVGSRGFSQGVHYWEVQVKSAGWGSVFIGVAPEDSSGWNGFGFINYRATQAFSSETLYGSYFSVNDKIGVLLDMDRGTLSFFKDGDDFNLGKVTVINMGVAYHNLRKHSARYSTSPFLFPCVGLKSSGDELSISRFHWITSEGLDSMSLLKDILRSFRIMHNWEASYKSSGEVLSFDEEVEKAIFEDYKRKGLSTEFFTTSRPGIPIALNCSPQALLKCLGEETIQTFAISIGCRLSTAYGAATVLGVKDDRIWYSCERNGQKAWYWLPDELKELLSSKAVQKDTVQELSPLLAPLIQAIEEEKDPEVYLTDFNKFQNVLRGKWTTSEDAELVKVINRVAHTLDLEPTCLTFHQLRSVFSLSDCKELSHRSLTEVHVRFAALCALNGAVARALPFIDFNDAERRKKIATILINHFDASLNSFALTSTTRELYRAIKHAVFTSTKLNYWQLVVEETTVPTSAPPDEYERPDEIREITINRIQARHAIKRKDALSFEEKLRLSVFGQLKETLGSWEVRSLRRSFLHMQDAGQARAFFVKFIGEGVDDQGGPYRAVFQTAIGEEIFDLLELLVPCPNAEAEIGMNRDRYIFSSGDGASRHKLFDHMGKLMGLASRHRILLPLPLSSLAWRSLVGEPLEVNDMQSLDTALANSLRVVAQDVDQQLSLDLVVELLVQALYQAAHISHGLTMQTCQQIVHSVLAGNGKDGTVQDIVNLILFYHLESQTEPLQHFFRGLGRVLPTEIFPLFSADELDALFCGQIDVDIELLKKVAVYESVSPEDSHIQFFWRALEALTGEERAQFINFCSGRSRLPAAASDYPMPFKLMSATGEGDPDKYLPTARTCFFSLAVPKYSSYEVCLSKLRYAISNTELMDADFIDRRGTAGWENL